ncbi:hypothetical protein QN277_011550 [Acacia crassicarpa]|uniref:Neprosin PEP catalytic domain-containing protein n=1 Tax=Acacia crassicarpa TaxID=499986 RepID=A0AAE1MYT3_9FABA|nr:hypothetical protein QN277_011550 [Acacia crassicarpa]
MAENLGIEKTFVANVFFWFLLISIQATNAGHKDGGFNQKLEVEKLLKKLNKPAVKSIKSPDGDIIDCVSILKQPAFDHPKLKNHKIKMRPSSYPKGGDDILEKVDMSSKSTPIVQLWHQSGSCPEGTIPIRRIKEEDILRANSIQQFGKKNFKSPPFRSYAKAQGSQEYATVYVRGDDRYYGGKATINTWNPSVQFGEFSVSQIWLLNDDDVANTNTIEAGWQVNPQLYGDNTTRLFTYWTDDNGKTSGCYDLLCSGFVQLDAGVAVGASITPLSIYGNQSAQAVMKLTIWKDIKNGDWWIQYGPEKVIGYWPSALFSQLSYNATVVEWGGEVINTRANGQNTATQMGSGHFPVEGYGKASFFANIKIVNDKNQMVSPNNILTSIDRPNCYDIKPDYSDDPKWASYFFFGGPGINPNCP